MPVRGPVQFDNISFDVENEEALLELQAKLAKDGVEVTEVVDHKFIHSIYFTDLNGVALEASYWIYNPTGKAPDYSNPNVFQGPNPVPALKEAMEKARVVESS